MPSTSNTFLSTLIRDDEPESCPGSVCAEQILPERHLLLAILDRGVRDLITTEVGTKYRKDAIKWFSSPKTKEAYRKKLAYSCSFQSIVIHLDLTESQVNYIKEILKAAEAEGATNDDVLRNRSRDFGRNRSTGTIAEEFLQVFQDARNREGHT